MSMSQECPTSLKDWNRSLCSAMLHLRRSSRKSDLTKLSTLIQCLWKASKVLCLEGGESPFQVLRISRCICDMRAHSEYWIVESELFTTAYSVDSSHQRIPRYCRSWTSLINYVLFRGPYRGYVAALGI